MKENPVVGFYKSLSEEDQSPDEITLIHGGALYDALNVLRKDGLPPSYKTGWVSLDPYYKVLLGQWTVVTGVPSAGKSEWLDALMVNLTSDGWRFSVFSPENQPHASHAVSLMEKYIGKPFYPGPNEKINDEEFSEALMWLDMHFQFVKTDKPNLESILNESMEFASGPDRKGGVIIDPYNQLEHFRPAHMSETEFISQNLSTVIRYARDYHVHIWVVAHPTKMARDKDGNRPVPTPYDISGSASWYSKSDNCITIWRDPNNSPELVDVHIDKIRFKRCGQPGQVTLRYDRVTGRYSDLTCPAGVDPKKLAAADYEPGSDG